MCRVAFTDAEGMTHSVKVTAGSVLEAAALGLAEFRKCAMLDAAPGPATKLTVIVEVPGTAHDVPMPKLKAWLEGNGKSPAERAVKVRLREVVAKEFLRYVPGEGGHSGYRAKGRARQARAHDHGVSF
jgi:hypothetical protein